jgi:hypothetical protein
MVVPSISCCTSCLAVARSMTSSSTLLSFVAEESEAACSGYVSVLTSSALVCCKMTMRVCSGTSTSQLVTRMFRANRFPW